MGDLLGSNVLEIAIGVIFIFFLLSLLCSSINEFLAGLLKWRARDLVQALINMLGDKDTLLSVLYHPLVNVFTSVVPPTGIRPGGRSVAAAGTGGPDATGATGGGGTGVTGATGVTGLTGTPPGTGAARGTGWTPMPPSRVPGKLEALPVRGLTRKRKYTVPDLSSGSSTPTLLGTTHKGSTPSGQELQIDLETVPSYIPSRAFAQALLDAVGANAGAPPSVESVRTALVDGSVAISDTLRTSLLTLISDSQSPTNVLQKLADFQQWVRKQDSLTDEQKKDLLARVDLSGTLADARGLVSSLPAPLQGGALSILNEVETDVTKLRDNIETWFNNAMDAVSGAYKRRIKLYLFAIGCIVVLFTGADTLRMVKVLSTNSTLRAVAVAQAGQVVQQGGVLGSPTPSPVTTPTGTSTSGESGISASTPITQVVSQLSNFSDLFGYNDVAQFTKSNTVPDGAPEDVKATARWQAFWFWVLKVIGLLATALALSLGAPFWFDLLSKAVDLRAGRKPQDGTGGSPGTASGSAGGGGSGGGGK